MQSAYFLVQNVFAHALNKVVYAEVGMNRGRGIATAYACRQQVFIDRKDIHWLLF